MPAAGIAVSATAPAIPPLPADGSLITLVTKQRALAADYVPPDLVPVPQNFVSSQEHQYLRAPAEEAMVRMLGAALREGLGIKVLSGYRSYQYQAAVFKGEVATYGCTQALRESALPGHSEHQLGLAADLTSADVGWGLDASFAETSEGRWLASHAASYGFVMSYPPGKEQITGYIAEPWHYRYVTPPFAEAIQASGETSTEFLGRLGAATITSIVSTPELTPQPGTCPHG